VVSYLHEWLRAIGNITDPAVLWVLKPLTIAILLSGLDDLFVNAVWA